MPCPLRSLFPPGHYHVYARGVNRCVIFRTRADCRHFLYLLGRTIRRHCWTCWAFCLMGNHYHLVTCEYVIQNPVRAGICASTADWPWSRIRKVC